jgi:hypothetical protein
VYPNFPMCIHLSAFLLLLQNTQDWEIYKEQIYWLTVLESGKSNIKVLTSG